MRQCLRCGVVFELSPASSGWTETVLYSFNGGTDGAWPYSGVIFDNAGDLYGTTSQGGGAGNCVFGCGTVFKLAHSSSGWTETLLHTFPANNADGIYPAGNLAFDANGNLYGITGGGGASQNYGAVYQLSPASSGGGWTETVIHSFNVVDGMYPDAGVIIGSDGNLYGTTTEGGNSPSLGGVVFELTKSNGAWTQVVLYNFQGRSVNFSPEGGLLFDSVGNLYGVTEWGGNTSTQCPNNGLCGTVFRLTPTAGGSWNQLLLYSFCTDSSCSDGMNPRGGLASDSAGNLYGTTVQGGLAGCSPSGCGTVFEISKDTSATNLSLSASTIFSGASVTLTGTVGGSDSSTPTGTVTFNDGPTALGTGTLDGLGVATLVTTGLITPGAHSITAVYGGDPNYLGSTSSVRTVTVNAATFTLSASPTSQTISNGTSASYMLTVAPSGSYTSQVSFTCTFSPAASATCAANSVTPDANSTSTTLTVSGATPTAALVQAANPSAHSLPPLFAFSVAMALAGLFLFVAERGSAVRRLRYSLLVGTLLLVDAAFLGCGGTSTPPPPPQRPQTYQITITAAGPATMSGSSAGVTTTQTVSLTVNP